MQTAAAKLPPTNPQGRKAFLFRVIYVSTEAAERLYERTYGPLLHSFVPRKVVRPAAGGIISRQEAHRRTCPSYVDLRGRRLQRLRQQARIFSLRKSLQRIISIRQSRDDECPIAQTL